MSKVTLDKITSTQIKYQAQRKQLIKVANKMAKKAHLPKPLILIRQEKELNAGFIPPKCIVINSLDLKEMNQEELKAVIGHEMGHLEICFQDYHGKYPNNLRPLHHSRKWQTLRMFVSSLPISIIDVAIMYLLSLGIESFARIIMTSIILIIAIFLNTLGVEYLSIKEDIREQNERYTPHSFKIHYHNELRADWLGVELTNDAKGMIDVFKVVQRYNTTYKHPYLRKIFCKNWLLKQINTKAHFAHPSIKTRIKAIQKHSKN